MKGISAAIDQTVFTAKSLDFMQRQKVSQKDQEKFGNILASFNTSGKKTQEYLDSLSSSQMDIVRRVHGLADDINVKNLNEEGALNLLRQPAEFLDINNDGVAYVGVGRTRVFPPQNASAAMKKAFEEAKAALPGTEFDKELLANIPFMAAELSANIKFDAGGHPCGFYDPSEPGWTNIYEQPGFSWQQLCVQMKANLELSRPYNTQKSYQYSKIFLDTFQQKLNVYGVG